MVQWDEAQAEYACSLLLSQRISCKTFRPAKADQRILRFYTHSVKSDFTMTKAENGDLSTSLVPPVSITTESLSVRIGSSRTWRQRTRPAQDEREQSGKQKTILNDVNLNMPCGSLTAIMGASGSGKTYAF